MEIQNQIKRTLSKPPNIEYVRSLLRDSNNSRSAVASSVCKQFRFFDPLMQEQEGSCLKALRDLEAAGHFILPEPRTNPGSKSPRRLAEAVSLPIDVPTKAGEVQGLKLVVVTTVDQMRIWNEMMIEEHPRGAGPLVGRQIRYLVGSRHGWLGGIGFASAAYQLAERDAWIGWDSESRWSHLHFVVGMSRFLIRPSVRCHNLASMVLGMSMKFLANDFEKEYGYRPWLVESFVDKQHELGTCYKAANWLKVGETKGRGRQGRDNQVAPSPKLIYIYTLESDFRKRMDLSSNAGQGPLGVVDGLESEQWAEYEFGGASLGDARLSKRLVKVAEAIGEEPGRAFSGVSKGNWAAAKGYYRMIDQPDTSEVTMPNILAPHRKRTARRMMGQQTVLCIQDGCEISYSKRTQCEGLGQIGTNQTGAESAGLHLHSTLAVAANGLPLGVVKAQCIAPKARDKRRPDMVPIEEKKSFVWIEHHRDLVELSAQMPHTRLVDVCDREADFFELFDEQRRSGRVDLLVRAQHNRKILKEPFKLFAAVANTPIRSQLQLRIKRQSARVKKSKQKARPTRPGRVADMTVRYCNVQLPSPSQDHNEPLDIWIVHALETDPPEGSKPIEWFLLTTLEITSPAVAEQCLHWYALRWRIEDWHRVLKSGCRIEGLGHESAVRLRRAIAIKLVIAWRIMHMTLLGREMPNLAAEVLFSDIEIRTLSAFAKKRKLKPPVQLGEAVRLVAMIGGYLARNNDPPPGHQLLWQGYIEFQCMCFGFALLDDG